MLGCFGLQVTENLTQKQLKLEVSKLLLKGWLSVFVNKALLEHSHAHLCIASGGFHSIAAE